MVLLHHPPPLLPIIVLIVYQAIDSSDSDKTLMQPVCVGKLDQYQHLMDTSVTIYVFFSTSTEINQNDWLKRVASSSTWWCQRRTRLLWRRAPLPHLREKRWEEESWRKKRGIRQKLLKQVISDALGPPGTTPPRQVIGFDAFTITTDVDIIFMD